MASYALGYPCVEREGMRKEGRANGVEVGRNLEWEEKSTKEFLPLERNWNKSDTVVQYCIGCTGYSTNLTNRSALSYRSTVLYTLLTFVAQAYLGQCDPVHT